MNNLGLLIGIITGSLSIGTAIIGIVAYLQASAKKAYAAERDFQHLKKNQESLIANTHELWRQNDDRLDRIDNQLNRIETFLLGRPVSDSGAGHRIGK